MRPIMLLILIALFYVQSAQSAVNQRSIGTNLHMPKYYTDGFMLVDRMMQSSDWTTPTDSVTFDSKGYPLEVATEGQQMNKLLFIMADDIYPAGNYTISWSGTGTIWVRNPAQCTDLPNNDCIISGTDVTRTVYLPENGGLVQIKIVASDVSDHITDLHFITPGFEITYATEPVHPDYLNYLAEFDYIRVMDLISANHSDDFEDWEDRIPTDYHTYSHGVPWEVLFYIANAAEKDIWINIPHKATDAYVTSLVSLINSNLDSNIHIYVEYSNEVWNSIFSQSDYAESQGAILWPSEDAATQIAWWQAKRSAEIWEIFTDNLTGGRTFTRLIGGQGVQSSRLSRSLAWLASGENTTGEAADALAIAYYFGTAVIDKYLTDDGAIPKANITPSDVTDLLNHIDDLLDLGEATIYGSREQGIIDHAALAATYGIRMIGYEGGQSYYMSTGYTSEAKNASIPVLEILSNHPRMRDFYTRFLQVWFENGGKEFTNFGFINPAQSSGAWGLYDYSGDTEGLYKLYGLREFMPTNTWDGTCAGTRSACETESACLSTWSTASWCESANGDFCQYNNCDGTVPPQYKRLYRFGGSLINWQSAD